ncbi:MAG: amino acid adenylation domain-containing protein, partial [Uliginosibacterium sp.]|nr:amino acid adenylation domain-containing protein [Uliginosibacterium sp.]
MANSGLRLRDHLLGVVLCIHHIASDGWSRSHLIEEFNELCTAYAEGRTPQLAELPVQYVDYAIWQRQWLQGERLARELDYWRQRLAGMPMVLDLPLDYPRPAVQTFEGAGCALDLPEVVAAGISALGQRHRVTLFMTLLAVFKVLLFRYTGQTDIVVGAPIAGRDRPEIEHVQGLFLNTLVLRTELSGELRFSELLARVRDTTLGAYAHQDLPFEKLVDEIHQQRDLSRNPLYQVTFNKLIVQPVNPEARQAGLEISANEIGGLNADVQADLSLTVRERNDGIAVIFGYNTALFRHETIERMLVHYRMLLDGLVKEPEGPIGELPLLTDLERQQLLLDWNRTQREYPRETGIDELFEAQALRTPEAVAVETGQTHLSYRELNERANRVAHYLVRHGVGAEVRVGLCVERSVEMIVGVLGILKAGGAYVPLDPDYPATRLSFMLEDTAAPVLLTQEKLRQQLPAYTGRVIALDAQWEEIEQESADNPAIATGGHHLAYVIYTSGSTGRPKGTCIEHRSVVRLVQNTNYIELGSDDVVLQFAPISFDASTLELWGSLLNGAKLAVCPAGVLSLQELGQFIQERGVTTLWLTAALFHQMVDTQIESLRGVRQLLAGGDTLSVPHVRRMLEVIGSGRLINGYGPTENTTFTCCYVMSADTCIAHTVPIGRPISNTRVYMLDRHRQPVPVGVYGELYIAGDGLAREYLNQPQLTAERFVPDPFDATPGARLYRTGDLVRYRTDGNIEFLGRLDNQVKVRGFRIELGEIEAALRQQALVREAVVVVREDEPGDKRLVAYIVADGAAADVVDSLRTQLRSSLPDYMVPSAFVVLETLPLTPNGKVDRKALPAPERESQVGAEYVAPGNGLEQELAAVWQEVLRMEKVGVDDNFFDLGGNSLLVTRVHARIKPLFEREVRVVDLFRYPTIRLLASALSDDGTAHSANQNRIQERA